MPELRFTGDTHQDLVDQVRAWLQSAEPESGGPNAAGIVTKGADLTKDALALIAGAAPGSMRESEMLQALTDMGYAATDATRDRVLAGIDAAQMMSGDDFVKKASERGGDVVFEMNSRLAKEVLRRFGR